ncbi:helix-turn-helix transcriptional regulator [Ensifer sp. ENS05]|uniref:helix-turn-helix domain-containing protein n=1 Tax=Ensifer sp. ENS05 TaxID=2769277 RepID=UPI001FEFAED3|nr:helix-turn-helix transcriptional regulator [Ensifer sp. ENS05]
MTHVSENLRNLRLAAGISQSGLAKASGISRRMIVSLEGGDANISLSSLDKLAAALDVSFVDLVRDPTRTSRTDINQVTWRGQSADSEAVLLCSAPASSETQMWLWALAPGETYTAEPDPQGWHEMVFVIDGTLRLELSGVAHDYVAGSYVVYSTAQAYSYANPHERTLRFIRNLVT